MKTLCHPKLRPEYVDSLRKLRTQRPQALEEKKKIN